MRGAVGSSFETAATIPATKSKKRERSPTVAMRISWDEKEALERAAGKQSLNAYLRDVVFGGNAVSLKPTRSRGRNPVKDFEALGRVLAALGRSGIPDALERLARNHQSAEHKMLLQACADIAAMRVDLVKALGLQSNNKMKGGATAL